MSPNPLWLMFSLNRKSWRQTHTEGEHHVKMKTRIEVMLLEAKNAKDWQQTTRSLARSMEQTCSHRLQKELTLLTPWACTSSPWDHKLLLFPPLSSWYLVTAAPLNEYSQENSNVHYHVINFPLWKVIWKTSKKNLCLEPICEWLSWLPQPNNIIIAKGTFQEENNAALDRPTHR